MSKEFESVEIQTEEKLNVNKNKETFLNEIVELSKKYNLSISHESTSGEFIIEEYNESSTIWLLDAILD